MEDTQNNELENNDSLIRVDKNLAKNSLEWLDDFGQDYMLCFDLLVYISNCTQKNLFNFGTIEVGDFAKEMNCDKANLQRVHPSAKRGISLEERSKTAITLFEHALFKLGKSNLQYTTTVYDHSKHETIEKTKFISILKEINIHIPNGKSKSKIYYTYVTSDDFVYNLSRFFFFIKPKDSKKLKEKKLLLLYFYIKNLENSKFTEFIESDFQKLCNLAGLQINEENIKDTKAKLKIRKLDVLKKIIPFDYEFVKVTGRWKYGVKFLFPNNKAIRENKELKALDVQNDREKLTRANTDFVDLKLIMHYQTTFPDFSEASYKAWFFDSTRDIDIKLDIYFNAIAELMHISKAKSRKENFKEALKFFNIQEKE